MISPSLGIQLPTCFDTDFDRALDAVESRFGRASRAFLLFYAGWTGLGNRARTIQEYAARYVAMPPYGTAGHEANYRENQALIDYLFNACSAVECVEYSAHGLGVGMRPETFLSEKEGNLNIQRGTVAAHYASFWPDQALSQVLQRIVSDQEIVFMFRMRDVVTHRGTLPRNLEIMLGTGRDRLTVPIDPKAPPDLWVYADPSGRVEEVGAARVSAWQTRLESIFTDLPRSVVSFLS